MDVIIQHSSFVRRTCWRRFAFAAASRLAAGIVLSVRRGPTAPNHAEATPSISQQRSVILGYTVLSRHFVGKGDAGRGPGFPRCLPLGGMRVQ